MTCRSTQVRLSSTLPPFPSPTSPSPSQKSANQKSEISSQTQPTMAEARISSIFRPLLCILLTLLFSSFSPVVESENTNGVYSPCVDTTVQVSDGFTLGIAFASRPTFFLNSNFSLQLSPCDRRLSLSNQNAKISIFRPKVDEISLLTINNPDFFPENYGYMVAFAGRKYAARSNLAFVANNSYTVTSFTLVLEFTKGRLQNLYWKRDGCSKCSQKSNSNFVCLNNQDCAIRTNNCKNRGGNVDCSLGIQLAFSGTDKHYSPLNSWYEVANLRQYSLYGVYSNLKDSLTSQYNKFF